MNKARFITFQNNNWVPIFSILSIALLIRIIGLDAESAWIDEGYSLALAKHSLLDIIRGTAADQHPPLYYFLLHFWLSLGDSVVHARLLSVLLGVFNVFQAIQLGLKFSKKEVGFGAGLLLALNPMHVWYSQEVRQYMLLAVLTTAAMSALWDSLNGKPRWFRFGLLMLSSVYTQYFTIFIVFAQAIILVYWSIRYKDFKPIKAWIFCLSAVGILFLPWLPTAFHQFLKHPTPWIEEASFIDLIDVPQRLILGSGVLLLPIWLKLFVFTIVLGIFILAMRRLITQRINEQDGYIFLAAWTFVPYITISFMSIFYALFQFKQFLIILLPILILATIIISLFSQHLRRLAYISLLIIPVFTLLYQQVTISKDDWRGMSKYLQEHYLIGDIVYTNPSSASLMLDLYLDPSISHSGYPPEYNILTGGWQGDILTKNIVEQQLSVQGKTFERLWLVEFFPEQWDPDGLFPSWLSSNSTIQDDIWFGRIHLRLYSFAKLEP